MGPQGTPWSPWDHMGPHGTTWDHTGPHGTTWDHLGLLGTTWYHLGPHGTTGNFGELSDVCLVLRANQVIGGKFSCTRGKVYLRLDLCLLEDLYPLEDLSMARARRARAWAQPGPGPARARAEV